LLHHLLVRVGRWRLRINLGLRTLVALLFLVWLVAGRGVGVGLDLVVRRVGWQVGLLEVELGVGGKELALDPVFIVIQLLNLVFPVDLVLVGSRLELSGTS